MVWPCIPVRSKPSAPHKVRSGTSNCVHTPLIGCDHHCWMADILSLVSSTNEPLAVYRTIIDSSDHPFLGLSGRVSAPPFRHKPHAAGESCSHARSSLYGQPLDCRARILTEWTEFHEPDPLHLLLHLSERRAVRAGLCRGRGASPGGGRLRPLHPRLRRTARRASPISRTGISSNPSGAWIVWDRRSGIRQRLKPRRRTSLTRWLS